MDEEIKEGMRRLAEGAQKGLARSLPHEDDLEVQSRRIVEQARGVIAVRGKNIINEFKKVYSREAQREEGDGDR